MEIVFLPVMGRYGIYFLFIRYRVSLMCIFLKIGFN